MVSACDCNATGTAADNSTDADAGSCDAVTGECPCKAGVAGRQCDVCLPVYLNFSDSGCSGMLCSSFLLRLSRQTHVHNAAHCHR